MTVLTPRRPTTRRTTAVTTKPAAKATVQIRARRAARTGGADRRGATQPSGAAGFDPARPTPPPADRPAPAPPACRSSGPAPERPRSAVPAQPAAEPSGSAVPAGSPSTTGTNWVAASTPPEAGEPAGSAAPGDGQKPRRPARRAERASRVPAPGGPAAGGPGSAAGRDVERPLHPS